MSFLNFDEIKLTPFKWPSPRKQSRLFLSYFARKNLSRTVTSSQFRDFFHPTAVLSLSKKLKKKEIKILIANKSGNCTISFITLFAFYVFLIFLFYVTKFTFYFCHDELMCKKPSHLLTSLGRPIFNS